MFPWTHETMGVIYWQTYYPVVKWVSVRVMLALRIPKYLYTKSMGFALAYTQADIKSYIFMDISVGLRFQGYHPIKWIIWVDNNLYGLNVLGLVWFEKLKQGL